MTAVPQRRLDGTHTNVLQPNISKKADLSPSGLNQAKHGSLAIRETTNSEADSSHAPHLNSHPASLGFEPVGAQAGHGVSESTEFQSDVLLRAHAADLITKLKDWHSDLSRRESRLEGIARLISPTQ